MISPELERTAAALAAARRAFVVATVVRAQRPTSAHPGDAAIIHPDGRIEGFVGGACASSTVRLHALHVLETHEPLLLRIRPGSEDDQDPVGTLTVSNPCLSGGELEIFLEPRLPPARIRVMGESPIAEAMLRLGDSLGYDVQRGGEIDTDDTAVIVASHGQGDEETSVAAALRAGVPYVGLVASPEARSRDPPVAARRRVLTGRARAVARPGRARHRVAHPLRDRAQHLRPARVPADRGRDGGAARLLGSPRRPRAAPSTRCAA